MGTPLQIAQSIRERASALSLHVNVGVASNIDSAMHAARIVKGIRVLPAGKEGDELQHISNTVLDPLSDVLWVFERWGIRTLGQLAALPETALTERLGQEVLRLQRLAQGKSMRTLSPTEPPLEFRESMELDSPVADIESLSFIFSRLLGQLCARLLSRSLVACRSKVATDEGRFYKFISIAALHTATKHFPGPLTLFPRQATSCRRRSRRSHARNRNSGCNSLKQSIHARGEATCAHDRYKVAVEVLATRSRCAPIRRSCLEGLDRSRTLAAAAGAGGHVCSPRPGTTTSGPDAGYGCASWSVRIESAPQRLSRDIRQAPSEW
jgi:hypothetical protein